MLSRRLVLSGSAAMLASSASRAAEGKGAENPLRFGVVADPQYADAPPHEGMGRHYRNSLDKLRAAIAVFNGQDLAFVVTLGDLIDRDRASFDAVLPVYATLRHRHVALLGNHDFEVAPEHLRGVPGLVGLERPYFDFVAGGIRFVALDGNDVSLFAPPPGDPRWQEASDRLGRLRMAGAPNAKPWNGSLGDAQFAWLGERLELARTRNERVVVLNHYPVFPENPLNLWDAERVAGLVARHPHVIAYLNGHNHAGNYGERGGTHFVNFRGMVDTAHDNAFAIVEIAGDRMEIRGFGREPSRTLPLATA